jgi:5-hydroxyisourate hydrolase
MAGGLTTHVLDTALGLPAAGIAVELRRAGDDAPIATATTNADGRTDTPLLDELPAGTYVLTFRAGAYLAAHHAVADPPFLDEITVRFGVADAGRHHHVPLLLAPYGYSTYRGS